MKNSSKQRGIQLIEVVVAMAIGSIIALAITRAYMASFQIQNSNMGQMRLNETTRYSFDLLGKSLQKAAFSNNWSLNSPSPRLCSTTTAGPLIVGLNDVAGSIAPSADDFAGNTYPIANTSDVIRIRYFGEDGSTFTSPVLDCHGYPVPAGLTTPISDTLFVARDDETNEPTLYCDTSNAHANGSVRVLPLVTGVESLQILYGLDINADGLVDRYLPWNLVGANADLITSVKLSVVVRSPTETGTESKATTFKHFGAGAYPDALKATNVDAGANFTSPNDKRARAISTTEIGLRNFSYCN